MNLPVARLTWSVALMLVIASATAQLPAPDVIARDLAGQYKAKQPKLPQRPASEIRRRVLSVLFRQAAFLQRSLAPTPIVPESLILTKGGSSEHDIRPNSNTALGYAIMLSGAPDFPTTFTREQCLDNTTRILRFLVTTHGAGGVKCGDGKHWRNQWQSAFWACSAGRAAWLIWDELPRNLQWLAARMVCDEADRFVGIRPPAQVVHDTKAEENAWNATVIALAACMFPHHPHADEWQESAIEWTLSAYARTADLESTRTVDGKALSEWLPGANLYDDYTLENHDRVHPDYMTTIKKSLAQSMYYTWAGKEPPEAVRFNTREIYRSLKVFVRPEGSFHYPNGQDWGLHREPHWFHPHIQQAVFYGDREAAFHARAVLETTERMLARTPAGGVFHSDEFRFPSTQHMALEEFAEAYALMLSYGDGPPPADAGDVLKSLSGQHVFTHGKFAILRSPQSISSFAWGPQVMGLSLPLDKDLLLAPNERSLVGMVQVAGVERDRPQIVEHNIDAGDAHFSVCGIINRAEGCVEQRFGFIWFPDGRVIYADQLRQTSATSVLRLDLGTLSVLNEKGWVYHDGDRTLHHSAGERTFRAEGPAKDPLVTFESPWYNLDNKLGIHCLHTTGKQVYYPNHRLGNGRIEQLFHLNAVDVATNEGVSTNGQVLASTLLLLTPGQSAAETREAAALIRGEVERDGSLFRVTSTDERLSIRIDLQSLVIRNLSELSR